MILEHVIQNNNVQEFFEDLSVSNFIKYDISEIIEADYLIINLNLNNFITENNLPFCYNNIISFVENDICCYLENMSFILSKLEKDDICDFFITEGLITGLKHQWKKDRRLNKFVKGLEKEIARLDEELVKTRDHHKRQQILNRIKELEAETREILGPKWESILYAILGSAAQSILIYFGIVTGIGSNIPIIGGLGNVLPGAAIGYGIHKAAKYLKRFLSKPKIHTQRKPDIHTQRKPTYSGYGV